MAISLYTSRVILNTLGVSDYGIYNVIGGFVAMFTLLSGSLTNAVSRFLTYEIGKSSNHLNLVFSFIDSITCGRNCWVLVLKF